MGSDGHEAGAVVLGPGCPPYAEYFMRKGGNGAMSMCSMFLTSYYELSGMNHFASVAAWFIIVSVCSKG